MEEKKIKVWIAKYALTQGIYEIEVIDCGGGMVKGEHYNFFHREGDQWHATKESAIKKAEKMRLRKIASLEKQLINLRGHDFSKFDKIQ